MTRIVTLKNVRILWRIGLGAAFVVLIGWGLYGLISYAKLRLGPVNVSPLQKVTIGKQVDTKNLSSLPGYKRNQASQSADTYSYDSSLPLHKNGVIAQDNTVVFERIVTPQDPTKDGYATISGYEQKYGTPEAVVQGSKAYGWFIETYIYTSKGLAFIGNPNTDVIMEIQHFSPMSVSDYKAKYGQDLAPRSRSGGP